MRRLTPASSRRVANPRGIYSVPVLGGEERLVLEAAANPEMLPDGSLLVLKINAKRQFQIHHYWPETGKLEPLAAEVNLTDISVPLRTFPDGKEAAYFGRPLTGAESGTEALYALDLQTGKSRRLAAGLAIHHVALPLPMDREVFRTLWTGDGFRSN